MCASRAARTTFADEPLAATSCTSDGALVGDVDLIRGIVWAADHGATIINLSLAGSGASTALHDAVKHATAKGALVVAAAGNLDGIAPPRLRPRIRAYRQQQAEAQIDDAHHGEREERADGDDHTSNRDVEPEVLGQSGANAEDHAAPRIAVQLVDQTRLA